MSKEDLKSFLEIFENEKNDVRKLLASAERMEDRLSRIISKLESKIGDIENEEFRAKFGE